MSVHWKLTKEGESLRTADQRNAIPNNIKGKGHETCSCGYKIRGKVENHEKGQHHKKGKKQNLS